VRWSAPALISQSKSIQLKIGYTGFTTIEDAMGGKWLELLKEISPHVNLSRVPVQPGNGDIRGILSEPL